MIKKIKNEQNFIFILTTYNAKYKMSKNEVVVWYINITN